jgi:hypothetical protein
MEDLAGEREMILKKSKSNNLRSWRLKDGIINPLFYEIKDNFPIPTRQYFAGIWDGDGHQRNKQLSNRPYKTLRLCLDMAENGNEPVLMLSKIFDLSLDYVTRKGEKYKNYQPSYRVHLGGPKAEMFMLLIYPYLIENRSLVREILLERKCPENLLKEGLQFSWPYLAGYADAEGYYEMRLHHEKCKRKNGYRIVSSYKFRFNLTSNDFESLKFIKQQIIDKGFQFRKDHIDTYEKVKKRKGRSPENWKPTLRVDMGGGPKELSRFYKNFYQYVLIKKKRNSMNKTMEYSQLIYRQ